MVGELGIMRGSQGIWGEVRAWESQVTGKGGRRWGKPLVGIGRLAE